MMDRVSGKLSGTWAGAWPFCCAGGPAPAPSLSSGASPTPPAAGPGALAFEPDDVALSCCDPPQPANANVATSTDASHHRVRLIDTISSRVTWRIGGALFEPSDATGPGRVPLRSVTFRRRDHTQEVTR